MSIPTHNPSVHRQLLLRRMVFIGLVMLLIQLGHGLMTPAEALTFDTPEGEVDCDIIDQSLAVKVVYCVKMAVMQTVEPFLAQTTQLMMPVINVFMVLVLTLLGVRIASGERDYQKSTMSFLLRMGVVYLIADNFGGAMGGLTDDVYLMMEQLQAIAIPALYTFSSTCTFDGNGPAGLYIDPITYTPWEYIDCVLDYIFGFGTEATIASSLFGFIGSTFFTGTIGAMVFSLGVATVLGMAFFVFRVVYTVLVSYIYVGFLIILVPLFIPFIMFKTTESMFDTWLRNLAGAIAIPAMMVIFLGFAFPIMDDFVFGDEDYSLIQTLGTQEDITSHYRLASPACEMKFSSDLFFFEDAPTERIQEDDLNPRETGAMDWCGMFDFAKVDFGEQHVQELWEIGLSLLRTAGLVFLITAVGRQIPDIVAFMVGGHALTSSTNQALGQIQKGLGGAIRGGAGGLGKMLGGGRAPTQFNPMRQFSQSLTGRR